MHTFSWALHSQRKQIYKAARICYWSYKQLSLTNILSLFLDHYFEACQKFYEEEVSVTPPELEYDNMYLFCSARRGHMSYTNSAITEMCKHVRDTKITNFLEVFEHTMESMDMSEDEVIKGCKPVHKSTMRRRQLYLPHWSGRHWLIWRRYDIPM